MGLKRRLPTAIFPGEHWARIRTNNVIEWLNPQAAAAQPLKEIDPTGLVLFHTLGGTQNLAAVGAVFPEAKYQRCTVHFCRNVFSVTSRSKVKLVAKMLKVIRAQESKRLPGKSESRG